MTTSRRTARKRTARAPDGVVKFPIAERRQVASYLGLDKDDPVIYGLIAVSRESGLSVFRGELFAIDTQEMLRDGQGTLSERWTKRPAAGRDGLLAVARRQKGFRGVTGDVVCANDAFDVDWSAGPGAPPKIEHRHATLAAGSSVAAARDYRGAIVGAWAYVEVDGQLPFFYFAHLREHGRRYASENGVQWAGAWEYTSAMILKAAMSYVLRIKFGITGIVPADELKNDPSLARSIAVAPEQLLDVGDAVPEEFREAPVGNRLLAAVRELNDIDPTRWPSAKCEMAFPGRSAVELERLAEQIEAELAAVKAARVDAPPEPPDPMPDPGPSTPLPSGNLATP